MAQYEYRLSYEDKRKELVNFVFNCINDTMITNYKMKYRTVDRAEIATLTGNVSVLEAQLYYDETFRTLYLYYVMDKNNRWGRSVDCNKMYRDIDACIKDNIFKSEAADIEFMGPCKKFDGLVHECSANIANILTSLVFTYWTWDGLENTRNEFIMDKRYVFDASKGDTNKLMQFDIETEKINNKYHFKINPGDYALAFAEYQQLYLDTFGVNIQCANPNVEHMYLLNETDYSINKTI